MRSIVCFLLAMISSSVFAESYPKDLHVVAEPRTESAQVEADASKWLAHVGYSVIDPACVTVTASGVTRKFQVPAQMQLMSVSADGATALLINSDHKLAFANIASGEIKDSELPYTPVLKRWTVGDQDPGRRVHLLSLLGNGDERAKALFDRRTYYGLLVDTYKEDGKISVYNMDGSLKMTCDLKNLSAGDLGAVDSRYEFVNQAGPVLKSDDKASVDFVIHNSAFSGHIDLQTTYFSVQKREKDSKPILKGFCK